MHRDMKPHNLMLDSKWNCKLIDLGDAKFAAEDEEEKTDKENMTEE